MQKSKQIDLILNLLYKADELARRYPQALNEDLVFDLRKLTSLVEEEHYYAGMEEQAETWEV